MPEASPTDRTLNRPRSWMPVLACWAFPVVVWLIATMFLGGDLGKSTDDYAVNYRDPVTNAVPQDFDPFKSFPYFWRPAHNFMCFTVGTFLADHWRLVHVGCAIAYAFGALGVWLVLRGFCRSRLAPALAATGFMVVPMNAEIALWFCTISTAIGIGIFGLAALVFFAFARRERGGWWLLCPVFVLTFAIACFYEQSAAAWAGMPALFLALAPRTELWMVRIFRLFAAMAAAGAACVLYVVLLSVTAPAWARGGSGSFIKAHQADERLTQILSGIRHQLLGERASHVIHGSWELGVQTLKRPEAVVWGAALLTAALVWVVYHVRRDRPERGPAEPSETGGFGRRVWLAVFGVGVLAGGFLPVFVISGQQLEMRNLYVPLFGMAAVVAALLDGVLAIGARSDGLRKVSRGAVAIGGVGGVALGCVCMVGFQRMFQERYRQDQSEARQLKELVPDPPSGAIFVPYRTAGAVDTGYVLFDRSRPGAFETMWSAGKNLRHMYRRSDIAATVYNPWAPSPLADPNEAGVRFTIGGVGNLPADPDGGVRIPWDRMVPFVVDQEGRVKLIRRFDLERADHRDLEIRPAIVRDALADRKGLPPAPTITQRMVLSEPGPELIPLGGWMVVDGSGRPGSPAKDMAFAKTSCWGMSREAGWLAVDSAQVGMATALPYSDRPENFLLRATISEYDLNRIPEGDPLEIVVSLGNTPDRELGVLRVDPKQVRASKRWLPLVVRIPPRLDHGILLRVMLRRAEIEGPSPKREKQGATHPVWVTHGYQESIPLPPEAAEEGRDARETRETPANAR